MVVSKQILLCTDTAVQAMISEGTLKKPATSQDYSWKWKITAVLMVCLAVFAYRQDRDSSAISPTAHYTGYVWLRNDMSDSRLWTWQGQALYSVLEPIMAVNRIAGGSTIEQMLLARHQLLDKYLTKLITDGKISHVVEIAAGLSPRGVTFAKNHPDLTYIEADLPENAILKAKLLGLNLTGKIDKNTHHAIVTIDALKPTGEGSFDLLLQQLTETGMIGVAVVTEGLVNYFDEAGVRTIWQNFAKPLQRFPVAGYYLSDLALNQKRKKEAQMVNAFKWMLSVFVRGGVFLHFNTEEDSTTALLESGFRSAQVKSARDWSDTLEFCRQPGAYYVSIVFASVSDSLQLLHQALI